MFIKMNIMSMKTALTTLLIYLLNITKLIDATIEPSTGNSAASAGEAGENKQSVVSTCHALRAVLGHDGNIGQWKVKCHVEVWNGKEQPVLSYLSPEQRTNALDEINKDPASVSDPLDKTSFLADQAKARHELCMLAKNTILDQLKSQLSAGYNPPEKVKEVIRNVKLTPELETFINQVNDSMKESLAKVKSIEEDKGINEEERQAKLLTAKGELTALIDDACKDEHPTIKYHNIGYLPHPNLHKVKMTFVMPHPVTEKHIEVVHMPNEGFSPYYGQLDPMRQMASVIAHHAKQTGTFGPFKVVMSANNNNQNGNVYTVINANGEEVKSDQSTSSSSNSSNNSDNSSNSNNSAGTSNSSSSAGTSNSNNSNSSNNSADTSNNTSASAAALANDSFSNPNGIANTTTNPCGGTTEQPANTSDGNSGKPAVEQINTNVTPNNELKKEVKSTSEPAQDVGNSVTGTTNNTPPAHQDQAPEGISKIALQSFTDDVKDAKAAYDKNIKEIKDGSDAEKLKKALDDYNASLLIAVRKLLSEENLSQLRSKDFNYDTTKKFWNKSFNQLANDAAKEAETKYQKSKALLKFARNHANLQRSLLNYLPKNMRNRTEFDYAYDIGKNAIQEDRKIARDDTPSNSAINENILNDQSPTKADNNPAPTKIENQTTNAVDQGDPIDQIRDVNLKTYLKQLKEARDKANSLYSRKLGKEYYPALKSAVEQYLKSGDWNSIQQERFDAKSTKNYWKKEFNELEGAAKTSEEEYQKKKRLLLDAQDTGNSLNINSSNDAYNIGKKIIDKERKSAYDAVEDKSTSVLGNMFRKSK